MSSPTAAKAKGALADVDEKIMLLSTFLKDCSPTDLVQRLGRHRFQDNESKGEQIKAFLQEAVQVAAAAEAAEAAEADLALSSATRIDHHPPKKKKKTDSHVTTERGTPTLVASIPMSFITPRGKMLMTVYDKGGIVICSEKNPTASETTMTIPAGSISELLCFPKPEDCRKRRSSSSTKIQQQQDVILLVGNGDDKKDGTTTTSSNSNNLTFKGKRILQPCFMLPKINAKQTPKTSNNNSNNCDDSLKTTLEDDDDDDDDSTPTSTTDWIRVLTKAFQSSVEIKTNKKVTELDVTRVYHPEDDPVTDDFVGSSNSHGHRPYRFVSHQDPQTSSTSAGMPFVSCYRGVQDGVLYPLNVGLLFYKPPYFLPRSKMTSIACGRGGGGGNSRYVDMTVGTTIDNTEEFTNIARDELSVLNDYIHQTLIPAMKLDILNEKATEDDTVTKTRPANDKDGDEANGDVSLSDHNNRSRKRPRRAAAVEAESATRHDLNNSIMMEVKSKSAPIQDGSDEEEDEEEDDNDDDDYNANGGQEEDDSSDEESNDEDQMDDDEVVEKEDDDEEVELVDGDATESEEED